MGKSPPVLQPPTLQRALQAGDADDAGDAPAKHESLRQAAARISADRGAAELAADRIKRGKDWPPPRPKSRAKPKPKQKPTEVREAVDVQRALYTDLERYVARAVAAAAKRQRCLSPRGGSSPAAEGLSFAAGQIATCPQVSSTVETIASPANASTSRSWHGVGGRWRKATIEFNLGLSPV
jgi:hypothetical protein